MRIHLEGATLQLMTEELIRTLGKTHVQPSDCKLLSQEIFRKTGNVVSETTLKRLFGFAKRNFNFSLYTLDTLAQYMGFKHWDDFYGARKPPTSCADEPWNALREHALKHSYYTLRTIQHASGIPFLKTAVRGEFLRYIDKFLRSSKKIAPIIAPSGFGKSIALAQCVLRKWLCGSPAYPKDICCMLNADQLASINQSKSALNDWFSHVLAQEQKFSPEAVRQHDGRLVIVIDGLDERTFSPDKLRTIGSALMNFIHAHAGFDWIRIIVALRPSAWESIFQSFMSDSVRSQLIFLDTTQPGADYLNHTLPLQAREIRKSLIAQGGSCQEAACIPAPMLRFLSYPRHFELYSKLYKGSGGLPQSLRTTYIITAANIRQKFNSGAIPPMKNPEGELSQLHIYNPVRSTALKDHYFIKETSDHRSAYPTQSYRFTLPLVEGYFQSWQLAEKMAETDPVFRHEAIINGPHSDQQKKVLLLWLVHEYLEGVREEDILELMRHPGLSLPLKHQVFLFLLPGHIELARQIEAEHGLMETLFSTGGFTYFLTNRNDTLLEYLLHADPSPAITEALLTTLFMSSILRLDIRQAEQWLLRFRERPEKTSSIFAQLAERLMADGIELAHYGPMEGFYVHAGKELAAKLDLLAQEAPYKAYLLVLMASQLLLFARENEQLIRLLSAQRSMRPEEEHTFSLADSFLDLVYAFADFRDAPAPAPKQEYQKNIFIQIFLQLIQTARYLNNGKTSASIQQALLVRSLSHNVCLPMYNMLVKELLKAAYQAEVLQGKIRS